MNEIKKRDSFVFYRSFYESTKGMKDKNRLQIYEMIFEYGLNFNELESDDLSKSIFTLVKPQLDANARKWLNGCKGGVKKGTGLGNQNARKHDTNEPKTNLKQTKNEPNDNVNVNANDKDILFTSNKQKIFIKPSIEDIRNYVDFKKYKWNVDAFYSYLENCEWKTRNGKLITDWKQYADNWKESKQPTTNDIYSCLDLERFNLK